MFGYCLICSTNISCKALCQSLTFTLPSESTAITEARQIMTKWYNKSMMVGNTSYCSGTKEAEQRPIIIGQQKFHTHLHVPEYGNSYG